MPNPGRPKATRLQWEKAETVKALTFGFEGEKVQLGPRPASQASPTQPARLPPREHPRMVHEALGLVSQNPGSRETCGPFQSGSGRRKRQIFGRICAKIHPKNKLLRSLEKGGAPRLLRSRFCTALTQNATSQKSRRATSEKSKKRLLRSRKTTSEKSRRSPQENF